MPSVREHGAQGGCSSMATTRKQQKLDCNLILTQELFRGTNTFQDNSSFLSSSKCSSFRWGIYSNLQSMEKPSIPVYTLNCHPLIAGEDNYISFTKAKIFSTQTV